MGERLFITLQGTCSFRSRKSLKRHERLAACRTAASSLGSLQTALFTLAPAPLSVCSVSIDRSANAQRCTHNLERHYGWWWLKGSRRFSVNETKSTNMCTFSLFSCWNTEKLKFAATKQCQAIKLLLTYCHYLYNTNRDCRYACVGKPLSKQLFHKCRQYKGRNAIKCKNYAEQWTYINTNMYKRHKCTCSRVHINTCEELREL